MEENSSEVIPARSNAFSDVVFNDALGLVEQAFRVSENTTMTTANIPEPIGTSIIDNVIKESVRLINDTAHTMEGNQGPSIQVELPIYKEAPNNELGKYFKLMSATFGVQASWSDSLKSKSEINKYLQSVKEIIPTERILEQDFLSKFLSVSNGPTVANVKLKISQIKQNISNEINRHHTNMDVMSRNLNEQKTILGALILKASKTENHWLQEEINKAVSGGFWSNFRSYIHGMNEVLLFETPHRWACGYDNKTHGIDYKVLFRKMVFSLDKHGNIKLVDRSLNAYNHIAEVDKYLETRSNYAHPHISSGLTVCWGNANDLYRHFGLNKEFAKILNALQVILQNYNPNSPYCRLEKFADLYGTENIIGTYLKYERAGFFRMSSGIIEDYTIETTSSEVEEASNEDGDIIETYEVAWYVQRNIGTGEVGSDRFVATENGDGDSYYLKITSEMEREIFE